MSDNKVTAKVTRVEEITEKKTRRKRGATIEEKVLKGANITIEATVHGHKLTGQFRASAKSVSAFGMGRSVKAKVQGGKLVPVNG